jgi:hypothetical protein
MTDPDGVCARPAEVLTADVPYVRGWIDAKRKADVLAEQFRVVGLADDFPLLKADVNLIGQGVVSLGPVSPETALRLVGLISAGLIAEMLDGWTTEDTAPAPPPTD